MLTSMVGVFVVMSILGIASYVWHKRATKITKNDLNAEVDCIFQGAGNLRKLEKVADELCDKSEAAMIAICSSLPNDVSGKCHRNNSPSINPSELSQFKKVKTKKKTDKQPIKKSAKSTVKAKTKKK